MYWSIIALFLALAAEALPGNAQRREEIMDAIGRSVVLPAAAKPLSSYGQNYAFVGAKEVIAVFMIPRPILTEKSGCVHGDMKPCSKEEIARMVAENAKQRAAYASAGKRRWFASERDLPSIDDGGCSQITIRYDLRRRQVLGAFCNGR